MSAREMLIEFERRLSLMNPELASSEKVDSDTIFSFLYAYTLRFVLANIISADKVETGTRVQKYDSGLLSSLITKLPLTLYGGNVAHSDKNIIVYELPGDYLTFISCTSNVTQTYKILPNNSSDVPVKLIKLEDADKIITTIHNVAILPYPCAALYTNSTLDNNVYKALPDSQLILYKDVYTTINNTVLTYCRKPKRFNVLHVDGKEILDYCELPESVHMTIVEGAVEMFITEAKYRLSTNPKKLEDKR